MVGGGVEGVREAWKRLLQVEPEDEGPRKFELDDHHRHLKDSSFPLPPPPKSPS